MNMNLIYFIVAIMMFISFNIYIGSDQPEKGWKKRTYCLMLVAFFVVNVLGLLFMSQNPYKQENEGITILLYIIYIIPIMAYIIQLIHRVRKNEETDLTIIWVIYISCFILLLFSNNKISSQKILLERATVISYKEYHIKSTFVNDSIEGIDYVIKKKTEDGAITDDIIKVRAYKDKDDSVRLHLNQNESYIEEYATVDTNISFLGFTSEEVSEEKIYEIYLTDDMYEQK